MWSKAESGRFGNRGSTGERHLNIGMGRPSGRPICLSGPKGFEAQQRKIARAGSRACRGRAMTTSGKPQSICSSIFSF